MQVELKKRGIKPDGMTVQLRKRFYFPPNHLTVSTFHQNNKESYTVYNIKNTLLEYFQLNIEDTEQCLRPTFVEHFKLYRMVYDLIGIANKT